MPTGRLFGDHVEAADGLEAVAKAADLQPDVVVMDLNIPGINGIEATRRVVEASPLDVSPKTVRNHVSNLFTKLQVADRAQAIVRARSAGLGGDD